MTEVRHFKWSSEPLCICLYLGLNPGSSIVQGFVQGRGQCRVNHWSYTVGTLTGVKRDLGPVLPVVNIPIHPGMDFTSMFSLC